MSTFKVGDKVKRVAQGNLSSSQYSTVKGSITTVRSISSTHIRDAIGSSFTYDYFNLIYTKVESKKIIGGEVV